jgi:hypothetical protein
MLTDRSEPINKMNNGWNNIYLALQMFASCIHGPENKKTATLHSLCERERENTEVSSYYESTVLHNDAFLQSIAVLKERYATIAVIAGRQVLKINELFRI